MISIFTIPKAFSDPHIKLIQLNAIRSWQKLGNEYEIMLIGKDERVGWMARELKVKHLPQVEYNRYGTPLLDSAFSLAREHTRFDYLGFINTDIILSSDFLRIKLVIEKFKKFLVVGQRHMLKLNVGLKFDDTWEDDIKRLVKECGYLDARNAMDYFIFHKNTFKNIPPFAVGRVCWDNWMIYESRRIKMSVIDATPMITAIHQKHEYTHIKDKGTDRDNNTEAKENRILAGGFDHIFDLDDTDLIFTADGFIRKKLSLKKALDYCRRSPEILPCPWLWRILRRICMVIKFSIK